MSHRDAEWYRFNLGKEIGDLPERPDDNRCELCEMTYRSKLIPDCDLDLSRGGLPLEACFRGWVCRGCQNLLKWIDQIGKEKLFAYLARDIPFGDNPPQRLSDGRCQLCSTWCGEKLNHDHWHVLEAKGCALSESQRGWICRSCNTGKLARVERIGDAKVDKYFSRALQQFRSAA